MNRRPAVNRSVKALEGLNEEASFVLLTGGQDGLECKLDSGTHEPTGTHLHLLAVHLQTLADELDTTVEQTAMLGLNAHKEMEDGDAVAVSMDISDMED